MATLQDKINFITKVGEIALPIVKQRGYGDVQLWTCICQGAIESGWGLSPRMINANAIFGVKVSKDWKTSKYGSLIYNTNTKECYDGKTLEVLEGALFKAYRNLSDCINDYFDLMEKRYSESLKATTVKDCITIIRNGGYATAPAEEYIDSICRTYNANKKYLEKYSIGNINQNTTQKNKVYSADIYIKLFESWLGFNEADGTHKPIIDLYNTQNPLPRGYKVKYTDAWCATTVSACAIGCGYTDIIPTECSCNKMIEKFKAINCWQENESVTPERGWIIFYDWQDGVNYANIDNLGTSEHVGAVVSVNNGKIKVIEGNKNDSVSYRTLDVNGRYIRGYGVPKYNINTDITPIEDKIEYGIVKVNTSLNIRSEANTNSKIIGKYLNGTKIPIYEKSNGWYRTDKGWVYSEYISLI